ncbi:MAG: helix-turn-helix transcriptional regulator [Ectothiorhodospiraceae bacterium]|nr:helix-turn-helix transcriptional regulator [Ectothiorhodospiraceae bacterium]
MGLIKHTEQLEVNMMNLIGHIIEPMDEPKTFGGRLVLAMERRNVNATELARMARVSKPTVHNWQNDKVSKVYPENLIAACDALSINPRWLVFGRGPMVVGQTGASPDPDFAMLEHVVTEVMEAFGRRVTSFPPRTIASVVSTVYETQINGSEALARSTIRRMCALVGVDNGGGDDGGPGQED